MLSKYINHRNEVIELDNKEYLLQYNDLHDYKWGYSSEFNKITNFQRGITTKSIPLIILASTAERGVQLKNRLFEVVEKDVLANVPGTLYIDDYYLKCYVVESKKSKYEDDKGYLELTLGLVCENPTWIKETKNTFLPTSNVNENTKDYSYDYPYDYANGLNSGYIINPHFDKVNFKLVIYGPIVNPTIYIGGQMYQVNTTLNSGEYLTINSLEKTIVKTKNNGDLANEFSNRNKAYSVFNKIDEGQNTISWNGKFGFDIILIEERGEPKWS